ncbi:MAG: dTMP kinase [Nitrospirae bacterium]|nr:dTMP kinase [Nitrospirota bacterium]
MLITFEGVDGAGKSTQVRSVSQRLTEIGYECVTTFEPGATEIGSAIRELLLDERFKGMAPLTEFLLFNAQRVQHIEEIIRPALEGGDQKKIVLVDRFTDSTIAYQGYGRGIDLSLIESLERLATGGIRPDITFLLDVDPAEGFRRNADIKLSDPTCEDKSDRIELEDRMFYERVRRGFLDIARRQPQRVITLDSTRPAQWLTGRIMETLLERLDRCP